MSKNKIFFANEKNQEIIWDICEKMAIFAPVKRPSDLHKNGKICNKL